MAEHRAATNALLSLFLVRGDQQRTIGSLAPLNGQLPSTVHVDFPVDLSGLARAPRTRDELRLPGKVSRPRLRLA
jgi:large subunit ribosomal protein L44